ncbi:hypothetical protein GCM10011416_23660 [Polaribacter pacificus]|uniref:Uncharacterized protein n=1 Tax=Polaribacter pacificus TaxID=1775173 RepID=A0A917MFH3_9FLAO|nr:hypothetical protein [Polaribacter pacificus]GGH03867.1 hypothetical protein GCM10011416_23660 [Polaribacter pacificus]
MRSSFERKEKREKGEERREKREERREKREERREKREERREHSVGALFFGVSFGVKMTDCGSYQCFFLKKTIFFNTSGNPFKTFVVYIFVRH